MINGINIEEVKKYNSSLKLYRDQASRLEYEIEANEKELKSLCEELTTELGVKVTIDNIEQIYNEQVASINQTLETGTAVINKIKQEASGQSMAQATGQGMAQVTGQGMAQMQGTLAGQGTAQAVTPPPMQPLPTFMGSSAASGQVLGQGTSTGMADFSSGASVFEDTQGSQGLPGGTPPVLPNLGAPLFGR